jgi:hypothetical protein
VAYEIQKAQFGTLLKEYVDRHNVILETTYNADVAATAVSVVSSNPPSKVDTQPDSNESGIFLSGGSVLGTEGLISG